MRIVIVGGPRRGKSTLARTFGIPIFCGDPRSKVKDPEDGVTYLPEGLPYAGDDGAAAWINANIFLGKPGPWVFEGHVAARALRRMLSGVGNAFGPKDKIIVLAGPARCESSKGQETMHKGTMTVWEEIAHNFRTITEYR